MQIDGKRSSLPPPVIAKSANPLHVAAITASGGPLPQDCFTAFAMTKQSIPNDTAPCHCKERQPSPCHCEERQPSPCHCEERSDAAI